MILACNVLGHLMLDAVQTKWGNGVHLFAPMSWTLWNAGWFWPESLVTYTLTGLGFLAVFWIVRQMWRDAIPGPLINRKPNPNYVAAAFACLIGYWFLPVLFMQGPETADNHFVHTLRAKETRTGKRIAFDRITYRTEQARGTVRTFAKEVLYLDSLPGHQSGTMSLKGRFTSQDTLHVEEWHEHTPFVRDAASIIGLGVLAMLWGHSVFRSRKAQGTDPKD